MIVIKTKLKVIPQKCKKCKYSYSSYGERFCGVSFVEGEARAIPYEFIKEKRNWEYVKPDWCPLREINTDIK